VMQFPEANQIPDEVNKMLAQGDWQGAVNQIERFLQSDPQNASLWWQKANMLVALNKPDEALACYEHVLDIMPGNAAVYTAMAQVLESGGKNEEALAAYDRALAAEAANVPSLKGKARILTGLGKVDEAIQVYDEILQLRPNDPDFLIAKGDALITAGQVEQAASYFEQAAKISPKSFGAEEWTNRGGTLLDAGQTEKALKFYQKAIDADGEYSWAYRGKALVLRKTPETIDEALKCLTKAIQLDPKNAWFPLDKGNIHYDRKEYEAAAGCYAKALEIDPKYQVAWRNLGLAQEFLGRYDQAVVSAEKSIELDPKSADAWLHKGFCLGHLNRLEESMASYRKALELEPENFWVNNNMGWTLSQLHKNEEALPFYQTAIKTDPTESSPWVNRSNSLIELRRYKDARDSLEEGLKSVSDQRDLLMGIGFIYTEYLFEHDKALEYYNQRLQLDPSSVEVRINVAECLIKLGRVSEGRMEAEKLVGQLGDAELECGLSLVILASYALEGDAAGRARQFDVVLESFKICCPGGKPRKPETSWNFRGLLNTVRASNISAESKFLVLTAIDVQQGNLTQSSLSFFAAPEPQSAATPANETVTANAEPARQAAARGA